MAVKRDEDGTTRGGLELPPEVQDRPEQNAGYDAAVRGGDAKAELDEDGPPPLPREDRQREAQEALDDDEARRAAADVRRRERSAS